MTRDMARDWMWSEACDMLARAERMHRELFRPAGSQARQPAWEPPVDILETNWKCWFWWRYRASTPRRWKP